MKQKLKLFLETSAILTGLNSPQGAAGRVLSLGRLDNVEIITSETVIEEVRRNIIKKFSTLKADDFFLVNPKIVPDPPLKMILKTYQIIDHPDDAPILAAAVKVNPDFLITWNTRYFFVPKVIDFVDFNICTPPQFLQEYWL